MDSNDKAPGFEDIDVVLDWGDDMELSEIKEWGTLIADLNSKEVLEPTRFQINSNGLENKEFGDSPFHNIYSSSKTKTSSVSQNGYS